MIPILVIGEARLLVSKKVDLQESNCALPTQSRMYKQEVNMTSSLK